VAKAKLKKTKSSSQTGPLSLQGHAVIDSAREIWMAGLGALNRAQEEGGKLFERLVHEGTTIENRTRRFATGQVDGARDAVETTVATVRERAGDTWDRLEKVFEDRVSTALAKLGVPGRDEMEALLARVESLSDELRKSSGRASAAAAKKKPAPRKKTSAVRSSTKAPAKTAKGAKKASA